MFRQEKRTYDVRDTSIKLKTDDDYQKFFLYYI